MAPCVRSRRGWMARRRAATSAWVAVAPPSVRMHHARTSSIAARVPGEPSESMPARRITLLVFASWDLHFCDAVSRSRAGSRDVADAMTFEHRRLPRWKEGRGDATGANPAAADMVVDRGRLEVEGLSHISLAYLSIWLRCFFREGVSRVLAAVAPIDAETGARRPLDVIYT